jgi:hypothetical protein
LQNAWITTDNWEMFDAPYRLPKHTGVIDCTPFHKDMLKGKEIG